MNIKYSDSIDLNLILEEINSITTVKEKEVSFQALRMFVLESILESHITFPENISNISKKSIITKTIKKVAIRGFDENLFKKILEDELRNHFRKREQNFYLLTSLSIDFLPFRKIKINNSEILIKGKSYPKEFTKNRNELLKKQFENEDNKNHLKVMVRTRGKNNTDTFKESLKDLDVFRALLNLTLNPPFRLVFGIDDKPINVVSLGKFLTLHFDNGETVDKTSYWFEPNFIDKTYHLKDDVKPYLKNTINWYLKRINLLDKRINHSICYALGLYVNAFDEKDKQSCFLKSWTALENLLSCRHNDTIIKRCLTVYVDDSKPFQKQILEGIKNYRNEFVHEGIEASMHNLYIYCHQIQKNILYLLRHNHLKFYKIFNTIEDANDFLDKRRMDVFKQKREIKMLNTINQQINTKS